MRHLLDEWVFYILQQGWNHTSTVPCHCNIFSTTKVIHFSNKKNKINLFRKNFLFAFRSCHIIVILEQIGTKHFKKIARWLRSSCNLMRSLLGKFFHYQKWFLLSPFLSPKSGRASIVYNIIPLLFKMFFFVFAMLESCLPFIMIITKNNVKINFYINNISSLIHSYIPQIFFKKTIPSFQNLKCGLLFAICRSRMSQNLCRIALSRWRFVLDSAKMLTLHLATLASSFCSSNFRWKAAKWLNSSTGLSHFQPLNCHAGP